MNYIFWETLAGKRPVQEFIISLPPKESDKIARQIRLLLEFGYVAMKRQGDFEKVSEVGVWEFKIDYSKTHYRIFCGIENNCYILLHIIKKKYQKLKNKDINIAVKRLLEYKKRFTLKIN